MLSLVLKKVLAKFALNNLILLKPLAMKNKNYYQKSVCSFLLALIFLVMVNDSFSQEFAKVRINQQQVHPDYPVIADEGSDIPDDYLRTSSSNDDYLWRNPATTSVTLNAVRYADDDLVYAAGQFGTIMKSTNGGETWNVMETPFAISISAIEVVNETEMWVIGAGGFVACSNDAGLNWDIKTTNSTANLNSIAFKDENTIYLSGSDKTVLMSVDGGATWTAVNVPDETLANPNNKTDWTYKEVIAVGSNIWLAVDGTGIPLQVLKSSDNGDTWISSVASGIGTPGSFAGIGVTSLDFNSDYSIAYASYRAGFGGGLLKTTDAGATWAIVDNLSEFTPLPAPGVPYSTQTIQIKHDVIVSDDGSKVVTSGLFGQILASTDGGNTWDEVYGGVRHGDRDYHALGFYGIDLLADGSGWIAAGSRGVIAKAGTFDAAQAVVKAGAEKRETFTDMVMVNDDLAYAVGFRTAQRFINDSGDFEHLAIGSFYKSTDGGESWTMQEGPGMEGYRWYSIESVGDDELLLGGMKLVEGVIHGVIIHSADSGETWEEKFSVEGVEIGFIKEFGQQDFYAASFGDLFLSSGDGDTWQTIELPTIVTPENMINALEVTAPKTVFIGGGNTSAGGKAFIIKTVDGGANWEVVFDSGTDPGRISRIHFVDARFGFSSGSWGGILTKKSLIYTSDYGQTWSPVNGTFDGANSAELRGIAMIDSVNAILYGASGQVVNADGTNDFSPRMPRFTAANLFNVRVNSANQAFVVGDNSTIVEFSPVEALNTAPGKFANQYPGWGEDLILNSEIQTITWSQSVDPDGQAVTYEFILEDTEGNELLSIDAGENNSLEVTAQSFEGIDEGQYHWRVEATDTEGLYSTTYPTPFVLQLSDDPVYYSVTFNIQDSEGNAIDDATISFDEQVLPQGEYIIEDLLPGTYAYMIEKDGYESVSGEVVISNEDLVIDVTLNEQQPEVFTVTFYIEDEDGAVITDAVVIFDGLELSAGEYAVQDVEPGAYDYSIIKDGYFTAEGTVDVIDQDVNIVVVMLVDDTSVEIIDNGQWRISPNPAHDVLTIDAAASDVVIYDITGKIVFENKVSGDYLNIDLSGFKSGMYIVRLIAGNKTFSRKIQIH